MESCLSYSEICRLCTEPRNLQSLFLDSGILKKITEIADLEVQETDKLPKQICLNCVNLVNQSYNFRLKCREIDKILRRTVNIENVMLVDRDPLDKDSRKYSLKIEHVENWAGQVHQEATGIDHTNSNFDYPPQNEQYTIIVKEELDLPQENNPNIEQGEESQDFSDTIEEEGTSFQGFEIEFLHAEEQPPGSFNSDEFVKCKFCQKEYTAKTLPWHLKQHSDKDIQCHLCNIWETTQEMLGMHIKAVHNLNPDTFQPLPPSSCRRCKLVFNHYGDLKKHWRIHRKHFECDICEKTFLLKRLLEQHRKSNHEGQSGSGRFLCDHCGKSFTTEVNLIYHVNSVHATEKPFSCDQCPKVFTLKKYLMSHLETHEKGDNYFCDQCGKGFPTKFKLNIHRESVHEGKKRKLKQNSTEFIVCDICEKIVKPRSYKNHLFLHSGEKPFACSFCEMKFATLGTKQAHEKIHTEDKPYSCEDCSKTFRQMGHLICHRRTHTGEQPFQCKTCLKRFASSGNLRTHERVHTGEKPYQCEICNESFVASNILKRHKLHKHIPTPISNGEC